LLDTEVAFMGQCQSRDHLTLAQVKLGLRANPASTPTSSPDNSAHSGSSYNSLEGGTTRQGPLSCMVAAAKEATKENCDVAQDDEESAPVEAAIIIWAAMHANCEHKEDTVKKDNGHEKKVTAHPSLSNALHFDERENPLDDASPDCTTTPSFADIEALMSLLHVDQPDCLGDYCIMLAIAHLERVTAAGVGLLPTNWRLLLITSVIVSTRVTCGIEVAIEYYLQIFPKLSFTQLLEAEVAFMRLSQWKSQLAEEDIDEFVACFPAIVAASRDKLAKEHLNAIGSCQPPVTGADLSFIAVPCAFRM